MAATAAVKRLKEGADVILRTALEQRDRPPNEQVPQDVQERLAADTLTAAKEIDDIFERTKLAASEETEEEVQREVVELQASIQEKEVLLVKSLEMVTLWEAKFAQLRSSQELLLFNPPT
mmetsp:Transcript_91110/g.147212  ORF Transcript_91110/g.147212 Transcript_91110/m.147212 type:complete len:120 (+) Transcript_91110:150-509(+)